ncbi:small, acid-soluble spore protein, alpha/beta type [Abyssisolibacter fermentans]|uniref:small, acid-soluble spore protein, alpha/beta type n=1 Tax=Abyssisolibacter fermentans TaxID=1766203 RepID=UPI00082F3940|nr:small, acid-soluble spore protein, alpha/beta type [Abyssisolibacter fermentans]
MSNRNNVSRKAREALDKFKMENAQELGIDTSLRSERRDDNTKKEGTLDKMGDFGGKIIKKVTDKAKDIVTRD